MSQSGQVLECLHVMPFAVQLGRCDYSHTAVVLHVVEQWAYAVVAECDIAVHETEVLAPGYLGSTVVAKTETTVLMTLDEAATVAQLVQFCHRRCTAAVVDHDYLFAHSAQVLLYARHAAQGEVGTLIVEYDE